MQKQSPLDGQSELFASLHPGLAALESAIGEHIKMIETGTRNASWVERAFRTVDPTAWSSKIEAARGNAEELGKLRVLYDEEALSALAAYLSWEAPGTFRTLAGSGNWIHDAIVNAIIAHDDIEKGSEHEWLKPIFRARIQMAETLRYRNSGDVPDLRRNDGFIERLLKIQVESFKVFLIALKEKHGRCNPYPTDLVVPGRHFQAFLNDDVDLRRVPFVSFPDCLNSAHPASALLSALLEQCDQALRAGWENDKLLKGGQNGRVNERQHAARMLDFLHDDTPQAAYRCGGNLDQQVVAQDARRYEYETYRHLLMASTRKFRKLIEQTVEALKASAKEGEEMLAAMESETRNYSGRSLTLAIIVNNCLSADASLRRWMRELTAFEKTLGNDLSRGAGTRVLDAAFEKVHKLHEYGIGARRDELAGKPRRGGGCDFD